MSTAYQKGLAAVSSAAGMEKTALNEKLLRRLLTAQHGEHDWDARGILQAIRTGDELPTPANFDSRPYLWRYLAGDPSREEIRALRRRVGDGLHEQKILSPSGADDRISRDDVERWMRKFSPEFQAKPLLLERAERGALDLVSLPDNTSVWRDSSGKEFSNTSSMSKLLKPRMLLRHRDALAEADIRRNANTLASGRHGDDAFVTIPKTIDPDTGELLAGARGLHPDSVVYRGGAGTVSEGAAMGTGGPTHIQGSKPRWFTGHVDIADEYLEDMHSGTRRTPRLGGILTAHDLRKASPGDAGPLTPHMAQDTRGLAPESVPKKMTYRDGAAWGNSPFYEMVMSQRAVAPTETHRYKRLADGRTMRVSGDAATDPLRQQ